MFRNVCFTLNNYSDAEVDALYEWQKVACTYCVYGYECGIGGTHHLQGYAELKTRTRLSTLKKQLPRAHLEERRGTQKQAVDYCIKDGMYDEYGILRIQGARNDLDKCRLMAAESGMKAVTASCNLQQIRVAEKYLTYNEESRDWKPQVTWIWGKTGTGKSKAARDCVSDDVYTKNTGTKWWDGYDAHHDCIIDDFRPSWWDLTYFLALLDRYEFQVEVKGGMRQFRAHNIIVTSAFAPEDCYKGTGECIQQLLRRVDRVIHLENAVPEVPEVEEGNTMGFLNLL